MSLIFSMLYEKMNTTPHQTYLIYRQHMWIQLCMLEAQGKFRDKKHNLGDTGNFPEGAINIMDEPTGANPGHCGLREGDLSFVKLSYQM